jgi:cysteine desulfurase
LLRRKQSLAEVVESPDIRVRRKNVAMRNIYLDAFASTPLDPRVAERLRPWFEGRQFGNAGSPHEVGQAAADQVAQAREQVAALVGADPRAVVITAGPTESNNLALITGCRADRRHVVSCVTEHPSVLEPLRALEADEGIEISWVGVDRGGNVAVDELREAMRADTSVVSLMAANNEIGTVHSIRKIGATAAEFGALFHCDAAQAAGKVPIDVNRDGIDLLSLSAHKMYGPMGVGALVASERARPFLRPVVRGGGQENGLRSGTVNVPGAVGLGAACEFAAADLFDDAVRLSRLRDRLEEGLLTMGGISVNGNRAQRLPGSLSVTIAGVPADALLAGCPELAFSRGSACSTGSPAPSHVLSAIGLTPDEADSTVRFGLTRFTTSKEVEAALTSLGACIERVRALVHA